MSLVPIAQPDFLPQAEKRLPLRWDYVFAASCISLWAIISTAAALTMPLFLTFTLNLKIGAAEQLYGIVATFAVVMFAGIDGVFSLIDWYDLSKRERRKTLGCFAIATIFSFAILHLALADEALLITQLGHFLMLIVIATLTFVWFRVIGSEFVI